jgi:altronate hydrolase
MPQEYLMNATPWLLLHPTDKLVVALQDLTAGSTVRLGESSIELKQTIPAKHKFTRYDLERGADLTMYGVLVGRTLEALPAGSLVTTENIVHAAANYADRREQAAWPPPDVDRWCPRTFAGYPRPDGQAGTANYWLVVPLVFCENRNLDLLQETLLKPLGYHRRREGPLDIGPLIDAYRDGKDLQGVKLNDRHQGEKDSRLFRYVDGIKFLRHEGGCGGTRQDAEKLCHLLAAYIAHPNVGGATVLSLGCQNAQIAMLQEALQSYSGVADKPLVILEQQGGGSEAEFMERAVRKTFAGLAKINDHRRGPQPLSKLTLGLECGGSDGFSGISANPVLGQVSDMLVALGGRAILAEFPELNGVEQELVNRCVSEREAKKFTALMQSYSAAARAVGSGFENNPSPGNIRDGLITDAIKSAGAARKGGTSPVVDVLDYPEPATRPGLSLLCTPGNDVESTTGLAGAGANLIAFTTGLGTPTGNPVAPVVKVSSNNKLAERMGDLIDFNAGPVITGELTIVEAADQLLELLIAVASGELETAAQRLGQDDFIPWKRGISL